MKNKEKYAKEIVEIACTGSRLAMHDGKLQECKITECFECDFSDDEVCCGTRVREWADSEYI